MAETNEKRKVLLGVTGSIAAYKSAELARILISRGYEVRVVMSQSAQEFIGPLTMEAITGNRVVTGFWEEAGSGEIEHIDIADWADVFVIAPATADTIAKLAHGFAESPLLAAALATKSKLLVAPAMNVNMLDHGATRANLALLEERGVEIIEPEEGALACGWHGSGRLADPWELFYRVRKELSAQDFAGKRIVVTTGPTREPIDPVRFITNRSSGKMGQAVASEAVRRGAEVTMIHGPIVLKVPAAVKCVPITTAEELRAKVLEHTLEASVPPDLVVMAAAVADFRPVQVAEDKIKKSQKFDKIQLTTNPDILKELGSLRKDNPLPVLVGFAVETGEVDDLVNEAREKLNSKQADLIVGNFAADAFDLDTNRVWLVDRTGRQDEVATTYKSRVANKILDAVKKLL